MNWWMIVIGAVLVAPCALLVLFFWLWWLVMGCRVITNPEELSEGQGCVGILFWVIHFVVLSSLGGSMLYYGLGA